MVAERGQELVLEQHWAVLEQMKTGARRLTPAQACELSPALRTERIVDALIEPDAADMDVNAIHQGYLRGLVAQGGELRMNSEVVDLVRHEDRWIVTTKGNENWRHRSLLMLLVPGLMRSLILRGRLGLVCSLVGARRYFSRLRALAIFQSGR